MLEQDIQKAAQPLDWRPWCVRKREEEGEREGSEEGEWSSLRCVRRRRSLLPAVPPRSLTPDPSHRVKGEREKIWTGENESASTRRKVVKYPWNLQRLWHFRHSQTQFRTMAMAEMSTELLEGSSCICGQYPQ